MSQLDDLLNYLKGQIGKPYELGAEGPDSFDCSGLSYTAFEDICGLTLPRSSTDQFHCGKIIDKSQLKEGDLIFFNTGWTDRKPNHLGIVSAPSFMINANSYNNSVKEETYTNSYWQNAYYGARRLIDVLSPFPDVKVIDINFPYILDLYDRGVVQGYPDGTFQQGNSINRAEVLKIILETFNISLIETGDSPFPDVLTTDWFFKYVKTAYDKGIIAGYPDGTFKPANPVNRVECLKMALNTAGVTLPSSGALNFTDVQSGDWYYYYVMYAVENQLIDPVSETLFGSAEEMKRGEMCRGVSKLLITNY